MTHAPQFWANRLPAEYRALFWDHINVFNISGETAHAWVVKEIRRREEFQFQPRTEI